MDKTRYLGILHKKLKVLPHDEYETAMGYYQEFFAEATTEEEALAALPDPNSAAAKILLEFGEKEKKFPVGLVVAAVLTSPITFPIAIALAAVGFSLFVTVISLGFSLYFVALSFAVGGITSLILTVPAFFSSFANGLCFLGAALVLMPLSYFVFIFCNFVVRSICSLVRKGMLKLMKRGVK